MDSNYLPDFKISLRPNNQISITRQRITRKGSPFFLSVDNGTHRKIDIDNLLTRYADRNGIDSYYDSRLRKVTLIPKEGKSDSVSKGVNETLLLDLTNKFQRSKSDDRACENKEKKGYGAKPSVKNFSHKSGQKIRESGAVIDLLCDGDVSRCRVITLTLPSSEKEAYIALSNWSGYATNRLLQVIRRKKDDKFHWFYCVEHQKRGALHWHICLYHEDKDTSRAVANEIVSKWRDILRDIGERSGLDLLYSKGFGRTVTSSEMQSINQEMRKGCGAYFSKYAAKTSHGRESREIEDINTRNARLYPPSSFWGRSQNLARLCRENSFLYRFDGIENEESESLRCDVLDMLTESDIKITHSFKFKKEVTASYGTLTVCEGETEVFYVSPEDYMRILSLCRSRFGNRPTSSIPERARRGGYLSEYERDIGYF